MLLRRLCSTTTGTTIRRNISSCQKQFVPECAEIEQQTFVRLQQTLSEVDKLLVLTGAGISTESGIPDYRSKIKGRYEKHRPITHQEFLNSEQWRRRYWARNFLAWPRFSAAQSNRTHKVLAEWERSSPQRFLWLITQNVDGLHRKAGSQKMTELHGCGHFVRCMSCGNKFERELVQRWLADLNAGWATGELGELRPDGDVDVSEAALHAFSIPHCPDCGPGSILKTDVVFFGDCVPAGVVGHCQEMVEQCTGLLVLGSSLTVLSGLRFVIQAHLRGVPILIVNIGETRADVMATVKLEAKCSDVVSRLRLVERN